MAFNPGPGRGTSFGHNTSTITANASNTSSSLRNNSLSQPGQSALQARINSKRLELQNLQQLRDLSQTLTTHLETLEGKLGSLRDGAQSVALVMANWGSVLGVIRMAGMRVPVPKAEGHEEGETDGGENGEPEDVKGKEKQQELPVPLVRIPVQPKGEGGG